MEAASRLLVERGWRSTTMAAVADASGVAVQTVYFVFHTKQKLLADVYDYAVLGDVGAPPPDAQLWFTAVLEDPDPRHGLQLFVEGNARILVRVGPLVHVLLASGEPDVRALFDSREQLRHQAFAAYVESLRSRGHLRGGLDSSRATDILHVLLGPQLFASVASLGWTTDEWTDWITTTATQQILEQP